MNIDYPYQIDRRGRTATATDDEHLRAMIERVIFTTPGERVNRPTFGSGLLQLVFAPNSAELASATQFLVQGALQQWLGDVILVEEVQVTSEDATVRVAVTYTVRQTQEQHAALFVRGGQPTS